MAKFLRRLVKRRDAAPNRQPEQPRMQSEEERPTMQSDAVLTTALSDKDAQSDEDVSFNKAAALDKQHEAEAAARWPDADLVDDSDYLDNLRGEVVKVVLINKPTGFGFTIIGGDRPGELIQIGSIVPGGVADTDGHLRVADVLVRVNNESVVTYSHRRLTNLFQNIPLETQVELEVVRGYPLSDYANNKLPWYQDANVNRAPKAYNANIADMLMETVMVKIIKGPLGFGFSLSETQRGPVVKQIMDIPRCSQLREGDLIIELNGEKITTYSHNDVITWFKRFPKGVQANILVLRSPAPQHMGQDSHPEEQLLSSTMGPFQDLNFEVHLLRQVSGFGFRIIGGREEGSQPTVGAIVAGGAVDLDRRIQIGDEITHINNQSVVDAYRRDVMKLMGDAGLLGEVTLRLRRKNPRPAFESSSQPQEQTVGGLLMGTREVIIERPNTQAIFGFVLQSNTLRPGCMIARLIPGSPAEQCGQLQLFDELLEINGTDVTQMDHGDIVELIKASSTVIKLVVQQHEDFLDEKTEMDFVQQHIVEQGSLKLRVVKSIFYGPPAVGKTCTRKRLTGKITNLGSCAPLPSTGIEKPCTINLFHKTEQRSVLLTKSLKEWEEQDIADQCQTLLEHIMHASDNSDQTNSQPIEDISSEPEVPSATADLSLDSTYAVPFPARYSELSPLPSRSLPKDGALKKFIKSVTNTKQWMEVREGLKAIEDSTILHIIDTGGQPEFHDILPLLLQGPAIVLLFLNLTRRLGEHCEIGYRWAEGRSCVEYESQFTVKEMLFQLLVSVASHSADKLNTAVMFIGTYLDHVGTGVLHSQESELSDILQSTELFKKDVVKTFTLDGKRSLIFPLDNIDGSIDEVKKLRESIASVIEHAFGPVCLPTSWLLFHLVLRSEYEAHPGYCTLEQCREVAESCGIPAGIVVDILKFMHKRFGTVLYYDEVPSLTNLVICDPNIIFMRATKLVTLSFGANPYRPHTSEEIRKSGEIDPTLMEEEKEKEKFPFSMSHVVELFTHYNIISQIKKFDGSHIFFMPCLLLPDLTVGRERKEDLRGIDPSPLLILFSTGYVPLGLFSALIVHLSKLGPWVVDPDERRYKNKVQFVVDEHTCSTLVLMSHIDRLELRVQSPETSSLVVICPHVVTTLKGAIESLKSCHKYLKFHNSLGFYCSSDLEMESGTPHIAVCFETTSPQACWDQVSPQYMRCQCKPKCARSSSKLLDKHKVWFLKKSGASADNVQKSGAPADNDNATRFVPLQPPVSHNKKAGGSSTDSAIHASPVLTEEQLIEVKDELPYFTEWKKLGEKLGLHPGIMDVIKADHASEGVYECLGCVLQQWLKRNYDEEKYGPPTWSTLAKALQTIDSALAISIQEKHK